MADPIVEALARHRAAQAAVTAAREAEAKAQADVRATRAELHAAVVAAVVRGDRQVDIAARAELTREQVRRIARAAGVE